jgi:hypothetical protein
LKIFNEGCPTVGFGESYGVVSVVGEGSVDGDDDDVQAGTHIGCLASLELCAFLDFLVE